MENQTDKKDILPENPEESDLWKISGRHQNRLAAVQFLFAWFLKHDAAVPADQDELSREIRDFFTPSDSPVDAETHLRERFSFAAQILCECRCAVPAGGRPRNYFALAEQLSVGVIENLEMIDEKISAHLKNWTFDRVDKTALAILRVAVYELTMRFDIPPVVSINEALNLVKELTDPDAKRFVNGILDSVSKKLSRPLR